MRVRRLGLAVGLAWLAAWAGSCWASTASEYQDIRVRHQPTRIADLRVVHENLEQFKGRCVEFTGTVAGRMRCRDRDLLLLTVGESGTANLAVSNTVPQMAMGGTVRVIARAPESRVDLTYELVGIAWEREIAALEPQPVTVRETVAQEPLPSRETPAASRPAVQEPVVPAYAAMIQRFNKRLTAGQAQELARTIIEFSGRHGLDARLVMAVIAVESNFDPQARSGKGAMGLGQLMPATARGMGVSNPWDYRQNLDAAVRLIRGHLSKNSGNVALALASYNAGSGAVRRYGGVPPYAETQNYIRKVVSLFLAFAPEYADQPG